MSNLTRWSHIHRGSGYFQGVHSVYFVSPTMKSRGRWTTPPLLPCRVESSGLLGVSRRGSGEGSHSGFFVDVPGPTGRRLEDLSRPRYLPPRLPMSVCQSESFVEVSGRFSSGPLCYYPLSGPRTPDEPMGVGSTHTFRPPRVVLVREPLNESRGYRPERYRPGHQEERLLDG